MVATLWTAGGARIGAGTDLRPWDCALLRVAQVAQHREHAAVALDGLAHVELEEDRADVASRPSCALRNSSRGDPRVRPALGHQAEHVALAVGELAERVALALGA